MKRASELKILDRIMAHRSAGNTTDMAPSMYANPVSTYIDPERHELEVQRLFRGTPVVACASSDVAACGAFMTVSIVKVPLVVIRGDDGRVRAFLNVCRHRGVRVAEGCGTTRSFQ